MQIEERRALVAPWLEAWLLSMLNTAREAANAHGIPLAVPTLQYIGELETDETSCRYRDVTIQGNPLRVLRDPGPVFVALFQQSTERNALSKRICDLMAPQYYWRSDMGPLDQTPDMWLERTVLIPGMFRYLRALPTLAVDGSADARALAVGIAEQMFSTQRVHVTMIPVAGLRLQGQTTEHAGTRVRPLTPRELGSLGTRYEISDFMDPLSHSSSTFSFETAAIEVRSAINKCDELTDQDVPRRLLLALALLGFEPHGRGLGFIHTEPGVSALGGANRLPMPSHGERRTFDHSMLVKAVDVGHRLPAERDGQARPSQHTACYRFLTAVTRSAAIDAVVDYCIALESILLGGDNQGETSYKFRTRGSWFLASGSDDRLEVARQLGAIYGARSGIVHGSKRMDQSSLSATIKEARALAARAILKCLDTGWPSAKMLDEGVMGARADC